jgi:hypothetical protein
LEDPSQKSAKIALNSCNWPTLRVILLLLDDRHIYCYRLLAANWWVIFYGGWYENKFQRCSSIVACIICPHFLCTYGFSESAYFFCENTVFCIV